MRSRILFESSERVIRAYYDTDQNLTFYLNGFTEDGKIGAQLYLGYNDSNLYSNATIDFVGMCLTGVVPVVYGISITLTTILPTLAEIRGKSKGLLRQSFVGCMLHDITLGTTIASKVLWRNRYGQSVINNATHKYVYGT